MSLLRKKNKVNELNLKLNFFYINNLFYFIFLLIPLKVVSSPWYEANDYEIKYIKQELYEKCSISIQTLSHSPLSFSYLYDSIDSIDNKNLSLECIDLIESIKKNIQKNFSEPKISLGIQSKSDDLYLNTVGERFYNKENIYYSYSKTNNNISYKFKIRKFDNDVLFDDSYLSYRVSNKLVVTVGRTNKWWSPSYDTSLILSNSARPSYGISFNSYQPIKFKLNFLQFLGSYEYDLYINKLERDRHVPNALVTGLKLSFMPNKNLTFSIMRVAQYGGKNRSINSKVIKNLITGKDTTNRNLEFDDQAGNFIAGIDLIYKLPARENVEIFAQIMGEDGLDPILDNNTSAIFPSKRFGLAGIRARNTFKSLPFIVSLEHVNTDSGYTNTTYNHSLYKNGYRYKSKPIGASIDADSHKSLISLDAFLNKQNKISLKYQKVNINQNNNKLVYYGNNIFFDEYSLMYSKNINKKLSVKLIYVARKGDLGIFKNNIGFLNIEHRL